MTAQKCGDYFTTEMCQKAVCPNGHNGCDAKIHQDKLCEWNDKWSHSKGQGCDAQMDGDTCCYSAGMNPTFIVLIVGVVVFLLICAALAYGSRQSLTTSDESIGHLEDKNMSIGPGQKTEQSGSVTCDLKQLAELHERGMLSKKEFVQAKQRVISDAPNKV